MIEWLKSIWDGISAFFDQVRTIVDVVIDKINEFITVIGSVMQFVWQCIEWIPPIFRVFLTISIIVLVLYLILGRNAGGD